MTLFKRTSVAAFPVAILSFLLTQNFKIVNPMNFGWLWGSGDIAASFSTWLYFRKTDFLQWPLTLNEKFGAPWAKTIVYTDTPPIFAIPAKYLFGFVEGPFQYTGFQILLSTYLLVLFTALTIRKYTRSLSVALLGGLLISTSPMLIFRDVFHHYSLNLFWILAAGIFLVTLDRQRYRIWPWAVLFFIAITWMPYFMVPVFLLWLPDVFVRLKHGYLTWRLAALSSIAVVMAILGGLVINGFWYNSSPSGGYGLGFYNANLLSLINPLATPSSIWSQILPAFTNATDGQYEGFAYMGIGLLLVSVVGITAFLIHPNRCKTLITQRVVVSLCVTATAAAILAAGFSWDLGTTHLFSIPIPTFLAETLSIFRSSGRFMLLTSLLIALFGIITVAKYLPKKVSILLLTVAFLCTYADAYPQITVNREQQDSTQNIPTDMARVQEYLSVNQINRVTFIQPEDSAYSWKMNILGATALANIPVNDIFAARPNEAKLTEERDSTLAHFENSDLRDAEAWVLYPDFIKSHIESVLKIANGNCVLRVEEALVLTRGSCGATLQQQVN
jgi:Family of unknown function (DUF6311)